MLYINSAIDRSECMNTGQALKELRLMKGKTVKQACGNTINRGNYWRIENEEVIPRMDTFNSILLNLNVSFSDYLELYYDENNEYEKIMSDLKKAFELKKIDTLKNLSYYCESQYHLTNMDYYLHTKCLSGIFIDRINNDPYNKDDSDILKDYLFSCPNWTYYEVRLLTNSLFLYDDNSIITFFYKTIRYVEKIENRKNCDELKMKISENIITHFIYKKNYKKANEVYMVMSKLELNESSTNARIVKMWTSGLVDVLLKGDRAGMKKVEKALSIYEMLDMEGQYRLHKNWTNTLMK